MKSMIGTTSLFLAIQGLAILAVALPTTPATAQQLDTPAMSVIDEGQGSVAIEITAGASGAPSGFQIQWISRQDYDVSGGWPADEFDPAISSANFRGQPTLNTSDGTTTFILGPLQGARVQIGDLFDETGVGATNRSELSGDTEYLFRVIASFPLASGVSAPSGLQSTRTLTSGSGCTYTQGFYKNHSSAWPILSLTLGTVTYTQAQLLQIFGQPARGNGLISLAHQLIATRLNVAARCAPGEHPDRHPECQYAHRQPGRAVDRLRLAGSQRHQCADPDAR